MYEWRTYGYNECMDIKKILMCWVGHQDLKACNGEIDTPGPISQAVDYAKLDEEKPYNEVHLLYNIKGDRDQEEKHRFQEWLQRKTSAKVLTHSSLFDNPMDFQRILTHAEKVLKKAFTRLPKETAYTFHLSPGTSAMAAVWIILGKVHVKALIGSPARLIYSSIKHGVKEADIPFDLVETFTPAIKSLSDHSISDYFIAKDKTMQTAIDKLRKVAPWGETIKVLLTGETGTGKERFAKLLYEMEWKTEEVSKTHPFVPVNCAAIPESLIESELFGIKEGTASDVRERIGKFEEADGGTLFLDEIGELPLHAQSKVLRAIQEGKISKVGDSQEKKINVRIVAATHRNLLEEVRKGSFREDLYFRLAEAVIEIPSLRKRKDDILPLADAILMELNRKGSTIPGYQMKQFAPDVADTLSQYRWPGNVRELQLVIKQAAIWTDSPIIDTSSLQPYMQKNATLKGEGSHPLLPPLEDVTNLENVLGEIKKEYLARAYERTGTQEKAARLLGYPGRGSVRSHLCRSNPKKSYDK